MYISEQNIVDKWNSAKVKDLLLEFYKSNFIKAGVDPMLAVEIIESAWALKNDISASDLRLKLNNIFNIVKTNLKEKSKEINPLNLFDFAKVKTFLDFGSNRLDTVNFIAKKYQNMEKIMAMDVIPQSKSFKIPLKSIYYQIDPDLNKFPTTITSVDVINIQFVMHHFPDKKLIEKLLKHCSRILGRKGRLIIWEETYEQKINVTELVKRNHLRNIDTDLDLTKKFYALPEDRRKEFIMINDWLINVNNFHMQWSKEYRSWNGWIELLKMAGFKLVNKYNLGLRVSGRIKQGVHIIGEFTKL